MNTRTLWSRGHAPLAAILVLAAATASAEARMGGLGPSAQMQGTTGTGTLAGRQPNPTGYPAPAYAPTGPQRPQTSGLSGGGGTGGFSPGGGSGTKPIKKPNLQ